MYAVATPRELASLQHLLFDALQRKQVPAVLLHAAAAAVHQVDADMAPVHLPLAVTAAELGYEHPQHVEVPDALQQCSALEMQRVADVAESCHC